MNGYKECIVNFQDEAYASKGWLQTRFSLHPHGLLVLIDDIDLRQSKDVAEVLKSPLLKYKAGFSRLPFPKANKANPDSVTPDFLYEVVKQGDDVWVKFYIKAKRDNRWILLDQGNFDRLSRIYWPLKDEAAPDIDLAHTSAL